jgi:hypothetical protein
VAGNVFASAETARACPRATPTPGRAPPAWAVVDWAGGDLTLSAASPYRASGTGGSVPGADRMAALAARTAGVRH